MARTSELLAEQLRAPGFRTVDRGYDEDAVRDHLVLAHGLITRLEGDVEEFQARAAEAEAAAERAEAAAPAPSVDDDELLRVVFEGQQRADDLVAAAEAEAARIERVADERIAHLRDDREVTQLRAAVSERAAALTALAERLDTAEDDLRTVATVTGECRRVVGDRLAAALQELREPALAGAGTGITTSGNTERT